MGKVVKRIILGFAIILLTFSAIIVLLLIRTYMFNRQYESVLQNVLNLNTIKVESANAAGNITNSCIKEQKVEESGLLENAENMLDYLNQLDESISDSPEFQGNRSMVNSLRQLLVEYKTEIENIVALGDGTNFPPLNEDVNGGITSIRNLIPDLSSYCNNNITMELERSAVIQKNIDTNFRRTIYFTLVAFAVVFLSSIIICVLIVRSITHPINILKREITLVAEGDLTKDEICLYSKNEFSSLADAFNVMSNNLKDIIGKVVNVTSEIANAVKVAESTSQNSMQSSMEITQSTEDISRVMHEQAE